MKSALHRHRSTVTFEQKIIWISIETHPHLFWHISAWYSATFETIAEKIFSFNMKMSLSKWYELFCISLKIDEKAKQTHENIRLLFSQVFIHFLRFWFIHCYHANKVDLLLWYLVLCVSVTLHFELIYNSWISKRSASQQNETMQKKSCSIPTTYMTNGEWKWYYFMTDPSMCDYHPIVMQIFKYHVYQHTVYSIRWR